jgi:hypothetical protein
MDSEGGETINCDLYGLLIEWYKLTDSWCSAWPLLVVYRDSDGNGYYSRHEVTFNANNPEPNHVVIEYIGDYCLRQLES